MGKNDEQIIEEILNSFAETAPEFMTRAELSRLSGGVFSAKGLANLDSDDKGILHRSLMCSKVVYSKKEVLNYLRSRTKIIT